MPKIVIANISKSAAANPYLSSDGMVDTVAFGRLSAKIYNANGALEEKNEKLDKPLKLKFAFPMLCTRKPILKFVASLDKKGDHKYLIARGQQVKTRSRPPTPSSPRISELLPLVYEGLDKALLAEVKKAHSAATQHNRKALKHVDGVKTEKAKIRDASNAAFDENVEVVKSLLLTAGIKPASIVVGQSMFGKVVHVKLPNGGVVSIGKSDDAKLRAAKKSAQAAE